MEQPNDGRHVAQPGFMLLGLMVQSTVAGLWLLKVSGWNPKDSVLAVYPGALAAVFDLHAWRHRNHRPRRL